MKVATLYKRLFWAKRFPNRVELNQDVLTSEYMPSQKFLLRQRAFMSDGTQNPSQRFHDLTFKTRREAEEFAAINGITLQNAEAE